MDEDYRSLARAQSRGTGTRAIVGLALAAFLLGAAIVGYFLWDDRGEWTTGDLVRVKSEQGVAAAPETNPLPPASTAVITPPSAAAAQAARLASERAEQVAVQQGGLDQRVAAMEQRLSRLDLQAQAAAGNAARAEGLLIAFASRRAIERGAPLGYLADQLRLRFGDAQPNAVQTIIDAAQNPVTLDQLMTGLDRLSPELVHGPADEGTFSWLGRELGQLFVIRRESTPSPEPERRLQRARLFLESGRTNAAVAEVQNLPNAVEAESWVASARRYAETQRALELIETTAVLEPRALRDGSGERVEQPSPVNTAAD